MNVYLRNLMVLQKFSLVRHTNYSVSNGLRVDQNLKLWSTLVTEMVNNNIHIFRFPGV